MLYFESGLCGQSFVQNHHRTIGREIYNLLFWHRQIVFYETYICNNLFSNVRYSQLAIFYGAQLRLIYYNAEKAVLGSWAPGVFVMSVVAANNCTKSISSDSELNKNCVDIKFQKIFQLIKLQFKIEFVCLCLMMDFLFVRGCLQNYPHFSKKVYSS